MGPFTNALKDLIQAFANYSVFTDKTEDEGVQDAIVKYFTNFASAVTALNDVRKGTTNPALQGLMFQEKDGGGIFNGLSEATTGARLDTLLTIADYANKIWRFLSNGRGGTAEIPTGKE